MYEFSPDEKLGNMYQGYGECGKYVNVDFGNGKLTKAYRQKKKKIFIFFNRYQIIVGDFKFILDLFQ